MYRVWKSRGTKAWLFVVKTDGSFSVFVQFRLLLSIFLIALLAGCSQGHFSQRAAVPVSLISQAAPEGLQSSKSIGLIRIWGDVLDKDLAKQINDLDARYGPMLAPSSRLRDGRVAFNYLALSGGGSEGAFGAGLLNGWTRSGKRPNFSIVTGVSTGAIIAPFAFLGPKYDRYIKDFYTKYSAEDLLVEQPFSALFGAPAVADSTPFKNLIAKFITPQILAKIAREFRKGRYLLVGTTNLDAQRPVIWNMGAIAAKGTPESLKLFRDVILASASIPGVFPPVLIDAKINGQTFKEMHVDGSTTRQIFFAPRQINIRGIDRNYRLTPQHNLYLVRNARTEPEWEKIDNSIVPITSRSIFTLMKYYARSNLNEIYDVARKQKIKYHLAMVESDFKGKEKTPFELSYMQALYKYGYKRAIKGYRWHNIPPDYVGVASR